MAHGLEAGRCLIIGEVGLAHDGSLGLAHAFIDEIARGGADAVKFQTHIAAAESTPAEPFRVKFSRQDATRYDYWKRMEFTEAQWQGLADHAARTRPPLPQLAVLARGGRAADARRHVDVEDRLRRGQQPAAARRDDRDRPSHPALERDERGRRARRGGRARARSAGLPLAVLQCTTAYPCPPERDRPQHDPVLPRALRLLRRPVRSLGHHLSRPRRRDARQRRRSKCTSR